MEKLKNHAGQPVNNMVVVRVSIIPAGSKDAVAVEQAEFVRGRGIAGDKHYGEESRQVCLLTKAAADWRDSQPPGRQGLCFRRFRENVLLGCAGDDPQPGDRVTLGDAEVTVDSFKNCYPECPIYNANEDCPLKLGGTLATVTKSGTVSPATKSGAASPK
jgi:MOSC domain-containing protein YiiM